MTLAGALTMVVGLVVGFLPVETGAGDGCGSVFNVDLFTSSCNPDLDTLNVLTWNALALGAFLAGVGGTGLRIRRDPSWQLVTVLGAVCLTAAAWAPHVWRTEVLLHAGT